MEYPHFKKLTLECVSSLDKLLKEPLSIAYPGGMSARPLLIPTVLLSRRSHDVKTALEVTSTRILTRMPLCLMGESTATGRRSLRARCTRLDLPCPLVMTRVRQETTACTRS